MDTEGRVNPSITRKAKDREDMDARLLLYTTETPHSVKSGADRGREAAFASYILQCQEQKEIRFNELNKEMGNTVKRWTDYPIPQILNTDKCLNRTQDGNLIGDTYQFKFDPQFIFTDSPKKMVGFMKADLLSWTGSITMEVNFVALDSEEVLGKAKATIQVQPEDTTAEVLNALITQMNTFLRNNYPNCNAVMCYSYDPNENHVKLYYEETEAELYVAYVIENKNIDEFLGSPGKYDNDDNIIRRDYYNVFDRNTLNVHASFINNVNGGLLCKTGEFFYKPSRVYPINGRCDDFYIYFTNREGKRVVLDKGYHVEIELMLISYVNNLIL